MGQARGTALLAPLGNLELMTGRPPAVPPILIEVMGLDAIHTAVQQWMLANYRSEEIESLLSGPEADALEQPAVYGADCRMGLRAD